MNARCHVDNIKTSLEPFMLTNKRLALCVKANMSDNQIKKAKPKENMEKKHPSMFVPSQEDKLFWIFYVMTKGFDDYNLHQYTNQFTEEKKIKFKYIDKIREKKALIKSHKIQKIYECESDLINEKAITMKTFHVLCIIENIPFVYFTKNSYYEFIPSANVQTPNIIHKIKDYFAYEINKAELIPMYKSPRYNIANYDKPIKAISSFKGDELLEIAKFFNINSHDVNGKKKTKQILYQEIYDVLTENS
tara:strand:+ start:4507 stop:5250 length:744 start_codon:yes stop_codon:yes gene_type:complete